MIILIKKIGIILTITMLFCFVILTHYNYVSFDENLEKPSKIEKLSKISMMLEQTSGAEDYKITDQESWPTEGYRFNSELSKCENGGDLSWDDTNKIVVMTDNTSDKCYVYFDKVSIISFRVDMNVGYIVNEQAEDGMSWLEWIDSDYCQENAFYYSDGYVYEWGGNRVVYSADNPVLYTDLIIKDNLYLTEEYREN